MTLLNEYVTKLKALGYKSHEAARIYQTFAAYMDLKYLNEIIDEMERDGYVAGIQS